MPPLKLLVLRCQSIEKSKKFYEELGFSFVEEQHGNSPIHYAASNVEFVFELYPLKVGECVDNTRLGFEVDTTSERSIVIDPDGRKIEISPISFENI